MIDSERVVFIYCLFEMNVLCAYIWSRLWKRENLVERYYIIAVKRVEQTDMDEYNRHALIMPMEEEQKVRVLVEEHAYKKTNSKESRTNKRKKRSEKPCT